MESRVYGIINSDGCLIDTSNTELGAKQYATRNKYNTIGYRIGYNAFILAEKINGKWKPYNKNN